MSRGLKPFHLVDAHKIWESIVNELDEAGYRMDDFNVTDGGTSDMMITIHLSKDGE